MDELINQVVQKTGISQEQAQTAVSTVMGFLKERLPDSIAGQLDGVVSGTAGGIGNIAEGVAGTLGGMFGGNKD